MIKMFKWKF